MGGSQTLLEQALWFLSRATGLVSVLLVTGTVVLGCAHAGRSGGSAAWPRFTMHAVHRNLSLLTALFLTVHIASAIIDPYAGIRWVDAALPFVSVYHPLWLGLGTIAFELFAVTIVTSLVRTRLPARAWRAVHLVTYALWPVAMVHGLMIGGADSRQPWVIGLYVLCGAAVVVALGRRLRAQHPDRVARRAAAAR